MNKKAVIAATTAITLAAILAGCSTAGTDALVLAERWLEGDSSVQCVQAPSTWTEWQLGGAHAIGQVDGAERWAVEITGTRSMVAQSGGHLLVDLREDGGCVRWYEWPT